MEDQTDDEDDLFRIILDAWLKYQGRTIDDLIKEGKLGEEAEIAEAVFHLLSLSKPFASDTELEAITMHFLTIKYVQESTRRRIASIELSVKMRNPQEFLLLHTEIETGEFEYHLQNLPVKTKRIVSFYKDIVAEGS